MSERVAMDIELEQPLDEDRRAWLDAKLAARRGIVQALFDPNDPQRLHVEYQPTAFSPETLLDFIAEHGVRGQPLRAA